VQRRLTDPSSKPEKPPNPRTHDEHVGTPHDEHVGTGRVLEQCRDSIAGADHLVHRW